MAKIYVSDVINLPVDFNGHHTWHPRIAESHIENDLPSDQVGCIRNFTLSDGGHLRESLLSLSDLERSMTYDIIVSPMPIKNYIATFRCTPVTEGDRTFVEWQAEFDVAPEDEAKIRHAVGRETFAAGIRALAAKLGAPD
jgi:hypothetical protein